MIDPAVLHRIPLFARLNAEALRELAVRSTLRTFAADEVLWHAGTEPRGFFVIVEGRVRVVRTVRGRQHVIHVEDDGGTLGDVALFEGTTYPATAIAVRPTTCVAVTRDGLLAAIRQDPELALALLGRLAARVRHVIGRLDGLAARSVSARLAGYLLARRERAGTDVFTLGGSQTTVAEELGTVREVLGRTLRGLRDRGLIDIGANGALRIVDAAGLRAEAAG
ncbi:Crp/Fnr family transcriptional regulator [Longimicrobium sp.]|uniref:Crp/Fnr family transcriptional regulator n=1 Tax=Longimicrobium sp. TaxID=2029185 RepID=UPI002E2F0F28|nr:Crp/Fnr family transcriptional regulator [Longimicrobium sp.]HEX6039462.1 Crp/Fnr family transcriptional regulator [Longimicrobium sp.]